MQGQQGWNGPSTRRYEFHPFDQLYNSIMSVDALDVQHIPKPTAIFMSVPQYNKLFVAITQWFSFGIYSFEKESYMLSFIKISALYESYVPRFVRKIFILPIIMLLCIEMLHYTGDLRQIFTIVLFVSNLCQRGI